MIIFYLFVSMLSISHFSYTMQPTQDDEQSSYQETLKLLEWAKEKQFDMKTLLSETNEDDEEHYTLLHLSVIQLHCDEAELLLRYGADINCKGGKNLNETPLSLAVKESRNRPSDALKMIRLLCSHGAETDWNMHYSLMQFRIYYPQHTDLLRECLTVIHDHEKSK